MSLNRNNYNTQKYDSYIYNFHIILLYHSTGYFKFDIRTHSGSILECTNEIYVHTCDRYILSISLSHNRTLVAVHISNLYICINQVLAYLEKKV